MWILQRVGQNHQTLVDLESVMSTNILRQKTSHGAAGKQSRTLTPLAPNQGLEQGETPGWHSSNLVGVRKRVDMIILGGAVPMFKRITLHLSTVNFNSGV